MCTNFAHNTYGLLAETKNQCCEIKNDAVGEKCDQYEGRCRKTHDDCWPGQECSAYVNGGKLNKFMCLSSHSDKNLNIPHFL